MKSTGPLAVLSIALLVAQIGCIATSSSAIAPAQPANRTPATATTPAAATTQPIALKTQKDYQSYGLGVDTVRNLKRMSLEIDLDIMMQGMKDAMAGDNLLISNAQVKNIMAEIAAHARIAQQNYRLSTGEENKKAGEAFLAANKTKQGVVTLPSGLQYKILTAGTGKTPSGSDTVEVHYQGTLIDGTPFDSSAAAGQPAIINVSDGNIIAGFREALKLMPVGSKWQIFVPSQLGYLAIGRGRQVGPNATLIYEVELLSIVSKAQVDGNQPKEE